MIKNPLAPAGRALALAASLSLAAAPALAQDSTEIIIGAHMPQTGTLARSGQAFTEGMQVALKMCNAASPKYKVKVNVIDD